MSQAGSGALGDYVQALTQARLCSDRGASAKATQMWDRVAAANPADVRGVSRQPRPGTGSHPRLCRKSATGLITYR